MKIKIAILDDHQIVIDGLILLLEKREEIQIQYYHTDGFALLDEIRNNPDLDIVITDLSMPKIDGYEFAMLMLNEFPHIKIIALSVNGDGDSIKQMQKLENVYSYLIKSCDKQELFFAIETVHSGRAYFSNSILEEVNIMIKSEQEIEELHLTSREMEVIKCMAKGWSNREIGNELFISEKTVETHRKNAYRKTGFHSPVVLIEWARKNKLV